MKKIAFVFLIVFACYTGFSQYIDDRVSGKPYTDKQYTEIQGSPFLLPDWSNGVIYLKNGSKIEKYLLQLDAYAGLLLFKYNDQPLIVQNEVKEFVLQPAGSEPYLFRNGYKPLDKNTATTWYQVLQDGPVSLLKQVKKTLGEKTEYGSATKTQTFVVSESWYIAKADGSLVKIKKDKSTLLDALSDKKDQLNNFIEKEKLRVKSEEDMKAVVKAYNENAG